MTPLLQRFFGRELDMGVFGARQLVWAGFSWDVRGWDLRRCGLLEALVMGAVNFVDGL